VVAAGQRQSSGAGADRVAFGGEQTSQVVNQFPEHIEHGAIAIHLESFRPLDLVVKVI
jgi:hypothetical protein